MLKRKLWVLRWYCQCSVAYNRLTYWRMMSMPCCKHYLKVSTPCCEHQFEDGCALLQASFYGINALLQCPLKISLPCCKYRLLKIRGITALLHIPLWQVWEVICFFLLLPCRQNMFRILKIKISSSRRQIMRIILTHSIKTYLKVPTLCCSRNRYSFTDVLESYSLIFSYATWLARCYLKSRCWSFLSSCITSKINPILNKYLSIIVLPSLEEK